MDYMHICFTDLRDNTVNNSTKIILGFMQSITSRSHFPFLLWVRQDITKSLICIQTALFIRPGGNYYKREGK